MFCLKYCSFVVELLKDNRKAFYTENLISVDNGRNRSTSIPIKNDALLRIVTSDQGIFHTFRFIKTIRAVLGSANRFQFNFLALYNSTAA